MKNTSNIVFVELSNALFPERMALMSGSNKDKLSSWNLEDKICTSIADPVAVSVLNEMYENNKFDLVILDSWLDRDYHSKDFFEELFCINGLKPKLHSAWFVSYEQNEFNSPFMAAADWIKNLEQENYTIIMSKDHKYKVQLDDEKLSVLNYNHYVFVDPEDGMSLSSVDSLKRSIKLWYPN